MKIRAQVAGNNATVRVLMAHEMETGLRKDAAGKAIPAWHIQTVSAQHNGKPVMKAIKVSVPADVDRGIAAYAGVADRLMFDAADGTLPGGNATAFDWSILSGRIVPVPWFLAGGLTPANVADAVRVTGAPAVDVSSGVESSRGVKSIELIRAFVGAVKAL